MQTSQISHTAGVAKECGQLKVHWERQSQKIVQKVNECGEEVSRQRTEIGTTSEQRMDDLELLEKALSTLQAQQVRLRASVDEAVLPLQTESSTLRSKTDHLAAAVTALKMDGVEARHEAEGIERDMTHRFDNVGRVFKVFAEALHVATPVAVEAGFKD